MVGAFGELARQLENAQQAVRDGQQRSAMLNIDQKRQTFLQSVAEGDRQLKLRIPRERLDSMLRSRLYFTVLAATNPHNQIVYAMNLEYDRLVELLEVRSRLRSIRQVNGRQWGSCSCRIPATGLTSDARWLK